MDKRANFHSWSNKDSHSLINNRMCIHLMCATSRTVTVSSGAANLLWKWKTPVMRHLRQSVIRIFQHLQHGDDTQHKKLPRGPQILIIWSFRSKNVGESSLWRTPLLFQTPVSQKLSHTDNEQLNTYNRGALTAIYFTGLTETIVHECSKWHQGSESTPFEKKCEALIMPNIYFLMHNSSTHAATWTPHVSQHALYLYLSCTGYHTVMCLYSHPPSYVEQNLEFGKTKLLWKLQFQSMKSQEGINEGIGHTLAWVYCAS